MGLIYEPRRRAREYASLACNIYRGCNHGCTYCFAPGALHITKEEFSQPAPRYAILRACLTQFSAVLDFTERVGRRPERIHFDYGWWWLGWVSEAESKLWIA